jgi:hypothetical protein
MPPTAPPSTTSTMQPSANRDGSPLLRDRSTLPLPATLENDASVCMVRFIPENDASVCMVRFIPTTPSGRSEFCQETLPGGEGGVELGAAASSAVLGSILFT